MWHAQLSLYMPLIRLISAVIRQRVMEWPRIVCSLFDRDSLERGDGPFGDLIKREGRTFAKFPCTWKFPERARARARRNFTSDFHRASRSFIFLRIIFSDITRHARTYMYIRKRTKGLTSWYKTQSRVHLADGLEAGERAHSCNVLAFRDCDRINYIRFRSQQSKGNLL